MVHPTVRELDQAHRQIEALQRELALANNARTTLADQLAVARTELQEHDRDG